jgi:hypothetical protein
MNYLLHLLIHIINRLKGGQGGAPGKRLELVH